MEKVAELYKQRPVWTVAKVRETLGEKYQGESGLKLLHLFGFVTREGGGTYTLTQLGQEYVAARNRTTQVQILRDVLLQLPDFAPYLNRLSLTLKEAGPSDLARLLQREFGFTQSMGRNYASFLFHYGARAGLLTRIPGTRGRYAIANPSDPLPAHHVEHNLPTASPATLLRQLDRMIIRLGVFLAHPEALGDKRQRDDFIADFTRLPVDVVQNGNRELLNISKRHVTVALATEDLENYRILYRYLESISRKLLKESTGQ